MDALDSVVDPLREFSKDSFRLVKRCHKPDRKDVYATEELLTWPNNLVQSALGLCIKRELKAIGGAVTISCLMVANLDGFVIGPSGISWLVSRLLHRDGLPLLAGLFTTFYVGTKLMFHIRDAKQNHQLKEQ